MITPARSRLVDASSNPSSEPGSFMFGLSASYPDALIATACHNGAVLQQAWTTGGGCRCSYEQCEWYMWALKTRTHR